MVERPEWFDESLFPFESKFVDLNGSTVHYVDEGEGPLLLMLHGNPIWSFLCDFRTWSHMARGRLWRGDPLEELGLVSGSS